MINPLPIGLGWNAGPEWLLVFPNALAAFALIEADRPARDRLKELGPELRKGCASRTARRRPLLRGLDLPGLFFVGHVDTLCHIPKC